MSKPLTLSLDPSVRTLALACALGPWQASLLEGRELWSRTASSRESLARRLLLSAASRGLVLLCVRPLLGQRVGVAMQDPATGALLWTSLQTKEGELLVGVPDCAPVRDARAGLES